MNFYLVLKENADMLQILSIRKKLDTHQSSFALWFHNKLLFPRCENISLTIKVTQYLPVSCYLKHSI